MRDQKHRLLLLILLLIFPVLLRAQEAKVPVTIVVTDPSGAIIPHAQIRLVPGPDPMPAVMETDDKGKLRLDLLPRDYALLVSSPAFKRSDFRIEVKRVNDGQTIIVTLQVATSSGPELPFEPGTLLLSDVLHHEDLKFSAAQLKALPHVSVTIHNSHNNADETYSGVRVSDLLAKLGAPLGQQLRGTALASYLVATGSDRYQAVFSLAEVDPSFHSGEILVADTMNGTPLDA